MAECCSINYFQTILLVATTTLSSKDLKFYTITAILELSEDNNYLNCLLSQKPRLRLDRQLNLDTKNPILAI